MLQSGRVLGGRYRLGERLGQGGWGSVYAAVQVDLGRPVAIKVLHTSVALATDGLARFQQEARAAAALGHPNIAQVTDFAANPGEPPFLVMELLTGGTLGAAMRAQPRLPPARVAWIAYQILAGLDVAHKAGIVHRDIKPDNVFLVAMPGVEDFVKLLDFGIAKLSGDSAASQHLTTTGTMLGSPAFMAPEQVRTNEVDHRVDLYAVGATMYLALSGRMPFDAPTIHGLLLAITETPAVPLSRLDPSFDPALSAVVERAMHKDPNGRFATAAEMRAALEPWLGGMAAHATSTSNAPRPPHGMAGGPPPMSAFASTSGPPLGTSPPGTALMPAIARTPAPAVSPYAPSPSPYAPSQGAPAQPAPAGWQPTPAYASTNPAAQGGPSGPSFSVPAMAAAPAPAKSGGAVVAVVVAVVVLLVLVAGGGAAFFLTRSSATPPLAASGAVPTVAAPAGVGAAGAAGSVVAVGAPASNGATVAAGAAGAAGARKAPAPGAAAVAPPGPGGAAVAPGAAPPAGQAAAPGAATAVAILIDAGGGAAAPRKQFAGSSFRIGGGSFDVFDVELGKAAVMARSVAINSCYAATEFDAPDHQFVIWAFQVDAAGNVKSVSRATSTDPHPKYDGCMSGALRQVKWPASKAGASPSVTFASRTRDNP